jgi:hypothetical protein
MSAEVVYCVECGQPVAPTASFCKACGGAQELESERSAVPSAAHATTTSAGGDGADPGAQARSEQAGWMPPPSSPRVDQAATAVPEWQRAVTGSLRFTRDEWILAGVALALFIDLLALPWFEVSTGIDSLTLTWTATQTPDGWLGVIAVLGVVLLIADLLVDRLSPQTPLPALGGSRATTRFILAIVIAGCIALKFLLHVHFSLFGAGFYIGVVLAATLVVFAELARRSDSPAAVAAGD